MSCHGSVPVVGEGGVNRRCFSLPLAVPQVGAHAGSIAHGVGNVVLLMDALEEVGHGSAGEHCHILPAVGGRFCGDGSQLDVVFSFWGGRQKCCVYTALSAEKIDEVYELTVILRGGNGGWCDMLQTTV